MATRIGASHEDGERDPVLVRLAAIERYTLWLLLLHAGSIAGAFVVPPVARAMGIGG